MVDKARIHSGTAVPGWSSRIAGVLGVVLVALVVNACASAGPAPRAPQRVTTVSHRGLLVEVFNEPGVGARFVAAPPDSIWQVLPGVYDRLEIPVAEANRATWQLGSSGYRARRIEGDRLSQHLYCGTSGVTATPNADRYDVTLTVQTQLTVPDSGGTLVVTTVDGSATPRGVSGNRLYCSSKGTLEMRVAQLIVEALRRGGGGRP